MSASAASLLGERLRALHRQAGVGATGSGGATGPRLPAPDTLPARPPSSPVPEHIRRLLGIRARATGQVAPRALPHPDRELPGVELAPGLRLVERDYPCDIPPPTLDLRFAKQAEAVDPARLLHFDTETTGLAGGTGTRAFMIGAADWRGDGLRLRQLYITTMAAEAAMLECFASWVAPDAMLVSYNGRCYDAPLLATRYRLARMANPLAGLAHADLLFPVRRRFRGTWENCRLATVERRWLGVLREDDLPGSEAPRAWLDYLRGGSARDLRRVIAHNDRDLVSLGELCLKLAEVELADAAATA
jgi:uncharacterized protein YprB with RNaseH-like and TPR domain